MRKLLTTILLPLSTDTLSNYWFRPAILTFKSAIKISRNLQFHYLASIPFLVLTILSALSCSIENNHINQTNSGFDIERINHQIDSIGESYIQTGDVKGITIAVAHQNNILYNKGFGFTDSLNTQPVGNDHIFLLASISKLVGSVMVMKLVEEGKLSLNKTLLELLPDYPNKDHASQITLEHLLSHTSGLQDYAMDIDPVFLETGINPTKKDYDRFFEHHELLFEPGELYAYSNSGFVLTAMIIERITGKPFQEEVDRIINQPTGLDLRLIAERMDDPRLSEYFELEDSSLIFRPHWPWIKGDGGLTATAKDLARFPFYWSDGTLLTKSSFESMTKPTVLNSGIQTGYGLGVRTGSFEGVKVIGHTGGNKSGFAMMMFVPQRQLSIVVMVNTDNTPTDAITIIGSVALAVLDKKSSNLTKREIMNANLNRYAGTFLLHDYKNASFDTLISQVNPVDGHLYMKKKGSKVIGTKYYYMGDHSFAYEKYPLDRTTFVLGENGEAVAFRTDWNGFFQRMAFRDSFLLNQIQFECKQ